jgi:hypothetical protein
LLELHSSGAAGIRLRHHDAIIVSSLRHHYVIIMSSPAQVRRVLSVDPLAINGPVAEAVHFAQSTLKGLTPAQVIITSSLPHHYLIITSSLPHHYLIITCA